jgi:hypothetical protein
MPVMQAEGALEPVGLTASNGIAQQVVKKMA